MARRRSSDDDDVPRLPRGRGMALSFGQIVRIVMVATALIALIVLQKPCARSVSKLVTSFDNSDAGVRLIDGPGAAPPPVRLEGELLHGNMTPEEMQAAIERERARASLPDAGVGVDGPANDGSISLPDGAPQMQRPQP